MFNGAGSLIKTFAKVFFWTGEALFLFSWIFFFAYSIVNNTGDLMLSFLIFLLILLGGLFSIWLACLLLYGFGELVESAVYTKQRVATIEKVLLLENTTKETSSQPSQPAQ